MAMPSKPKIIDYWKQDRRLFIETGFIPDWGEPTCWACRKFWAGRYDVRKQSATWNDCMKAWSMAPLQRCHIVPRSLGGAEVPSNLFLMCKECHDLAPDTSDRKLFFKWVKRQSWVRRDDAKIRQSLNDFGVDTKDHSLMTKYIELLKSKEFREWCDRNIGLHGNQLPPYGVHYSSSTIIAAVIAYYEEVCK